jgi:hypothetical protein
MLPNLLDPIAACHSTRQMFILLPIYEEGSLPGLDPHLPYPENATLEVSSPGLPFSHTQWLKNIAPEVLPVNFPYTAVDLARGYYTPPPNHYFGLYFFGPDFNPPHAQSFPAWIKNNASHLLEQLEFPPPTTPVYMGVVPDASLKGWVPMHHQGTLKNYLKKLEIELSSLSPRSY